jgi:Ino eighty subunit 2
VVLRVAAPRGKEGWIDIGPNGLVDGRPRVNVKETERRDVSGVCAVEGCGEKRKYRSVKKFEVGGCSLAHLKQVEATIV